MKSVVSPAGRGWVAWVAAAVVLLGAGVESASAGPKERRERPDRVVSERLRQAADDEAMPVIITVKPGARRGLLRRLKALGATATEDYSVIEASSARLSARILRRLADDPDVVSISTDAPITTSGLSTAVSGTALGSSFNLRRALGLETPVRISRLATKYVRSASVSSGVGFRFETPQADNRLLLVAVTFFDGTGTKAVRTVTYGTQTAKFVAGVRDSGNQVRTEIWALVAPAVSATTTLMASMNASVDGIVLGAALYSGVSQTAPLGLAAVASGTRAAASVPVTSSPEQVVFGALTVKDGIPVAPLTPAAALWSTADTQLKIRGLSGDGAGGAQPTFDWTLGTTKEWAAVAVPINPAVESSPATGAGVTIAVIDSGLLLDGGGSARIKTTRDFTGGSAAPKAALPSDAFGHGTHVGGLIGGDQEAAKGVAPGVSYVSLRVLDAQGGGLTSHVIKAIDWAVANRAVYGINVLNLSLGHPIYEPAATDPLVQAVEAAVRAGIVVVVSAGNVGINPTTGESGYGGISSPGNAPSAITVGAMKTFDTAARTDDIVAAYSSRGPTWYDAFAKPDLVAPGHRLRGPATSTQTLYKNGAGLRESLGARVYLQLSGTSMATGVVSGTVALMIETAKAKFGTVPPPNAVKAMLQHTAFPLSDEAGNTYDALTQGAGGLNAAGALDLVEAIDPTIPAGEPWLTTGLPEMSQVDGQTIAWGQNIVWGDNIVWGNAVYTHWPAWATNIVWGDARNIVWGDSLATFSRATNIVWGDNVVWGNNIVWGDAYNIVWGDARNIVWGDARNIVWGDARNIVWGDLSRSSAYTYSLAWLGTLQ